MFVKAWQYVVIHNIKRPLNYLLIFNNDNFLQDKDELLGS